VFSRERRGTPFDALIVGLGNPGKEYARSRHNVGEEVVNELARRTGVTLKSGRDRALVAEAKFGAKRVVLAFPTTFMNDSGLAVGGLVRRYAIDGPGSIIVVHDELDLPVGVVRIKVGGGLAGHNGLRSITQHLHTQDYLRVRIGVGKPPSKERGAAHVLNKVPKADRELLDVAIQVGADACEVLVADGPEVAMRQFHAAPQP
jgi:PTH1 family peptidyl-tRNA hydrolase